MDGRGFLALQRECELAEGTLVEVDVHAVPRREDPREVHVEGPVLLRRVQLVVPSQ
jgi:hypothetical protein